ncbi:MAG: glycosyltransferase family 2 protein [Verrucomicrobiota bacterium]
MVPAYNYARYLPEALDSVLAQTWPAWECVVVDDGSTDDTPAVGARYAALDSRFRVIRKKNGGLSAARNTGIEAAQGDWVAFLDADDVWCPGFLAQAVGVIRRGDVRLGLVACAASRLSPDGQVVSVPAVADREVTCADIVRRTRFSPSTVVARRMVFGEVGGFEETLRSCEDRDMWIRIAAHHRVWFCGTPAVHIRDTPGSMSKNAGRMKVAMLTVQRRARVARVLPSAPSWFWWQSRSYVYRQVAWMDFAAGHRWVALGHLAMSFLNWPLPLPARALDEMPLFRLRALRKFLVGQPGG